MSGTAPDVTPYRNSVELESINSDTKFGHQLSIKVILSLVAVDSSGKMMMPYVNHHWFQGRNDRNIEAIRNLYQDLLKKDQAGATIAPSKEIRMMVFSRMPHNITNDNGCRLHYTDGKLINDEEGMEGYVVPLCSNDISRFHDVLHDIQSQAKDNKTLQELRSIVKENNLLFAPIDGLHRLQIIHDLISEDENNLAALNEKTFFTTEFRVLKKEGKCDPSSCQSCGVLIRTRE